MEGNIPNSVACVYIQLHSQLIQPFLYPLLVQNIFLRRGEENREWNYTSSQKTIATTKMMPSQTPKPPKDLLFFIFLILFFLNNNCLLLEREKKTYGGINFSRLLLCCNNFQKLDLDVVNWDCLQCSSTPYDPPSGGWPAPTTAFVCAAFRSSRTAPPGYSLLSAHVHHQPRE